MSDDGQARHRAWLAREHAQAVRDAANRGAQLITDTLDALAHGAQLRGQHASEDQEEDS